MSYQAMKQAQEETMEAQGQSFQIELERVKYTGHQIIFIQSGAKPTEEGKVTNPPRRSYALIAASNSAKNTVKKCWIKITSSKRRKNGNLFNPPKLEPERRELSPKRNLIFLKNQKRIWYWFWTSRFRKLELQQFSRLGYAQSEAISAFPTEKSSSEKLIRENSNLLMRVAMSVVIRVEALKRWQQLNVYRMSLGRYFRKRRLELICRQLKSFSGIKLKITPR